MFQRRNRLSIIQRLKELVWPQQGWRRSTLYIAHRLGRLPGTPYRVAAGFACGAAVSFTPFVGFHFLLAALLSLILRGNILDRHGGRQSLDLSLHLDLDLQSRVVVDRGAEQPPAFRRVDFAVHFREYLERVVADDDGRRSDRLGGVVRRLRADLQHRL
jgi:hypothetical protein